jgi:hypothetical protein
MLVSFVAFGLTFAWMVVHRYRLEVLEERYGTEGLASALEARRAEVALPEAGSGAGSRDAESPARTPAEVASR